MEVKYKIWFVYNGKYLFGQGLYELFRRIEMYGSIMEAAKSMNMSYRNAWGKIVKSEKIYNKKLIERSRGKRNVKSILTDEARLLMKEYEKYEKVFDHYSKIPYILPAVAVDGILFKDNKVLLIKRKNEPFKGYYALPGGFVEYNETTENAITREMKEETNLDVKIKGLFGVYSDPRRDPREHVISIVYELDVENMNFKAGDDAEDVLLADIENLPKLAFDHSKILDDFIKSKIIK
ncbi:MAG: NUDIX domain-containing protein [Thermoplasmata archaeon]